MGLKIVQVLPLVDSMIWYPMAEPSWFCRSAVGAFQERAIRVLPSEFESGEVVVPSPVADVLAVRPVTGADGADGTAHACHAAEGPLALVAMSDTR